MYQSNKYKKYKVEAHNLAKLQASTIRASTMDDQRHTIWCLISRKGRKKYNGECHSGFTEWVNAISRSRDWNSGP